MMSGSFTVVRPYYIPSGYYLARVESDAMGTLTLTYTNQDGSKMRVLIRPPGGDTENHALVPGEASPLSGSNAEPIPRMTAKGNVTEVEDQIDFGASGAQSNESIVSCTVYANNKPYRVEVSGTLPTEELARIAASCK